jgi:hypothetical protein
MRGRMWAAALAVGVALVGAGCGSSSSTGTSSGGIVSSAPPVATTPSVDVQATACQALQQVQQLIPQLATANGTTRTQIDTQLIKLNGQLQAEGNAMATQNPTASKDLINAGLAVSALQAAVASGVDVQKAQDALMKLVDQGNTELSCGGASASPMPSESMSPTSTP